MQNGTSVTVRDRQGNVLLSGVVTSVWDTVDMTRVTVEYRKDQRNLSKLTEQEEGNAQVRHVH